MPEPQPLPRRTKVQTTQINVDVPPVLKDTRVGNQAVILIPPETSLIAIAQ